MQSCCATNMGDQSVGTSIIFLVEEQEAVGVSFAEEQFPRWDSMI
jgi:hypothetical protein